MRWCLLRERGRVRWNLFRSALPQLAPAVAACLAIAVAAVTDATGTPTNSSDGSLSCDATGCSGVVNAVEKYKSVSRDGKDTDRTALLPN